MSGAIILDIVLLLVLGAYATGMYRAGLVAGALSIVGLLGGGLLALWGLPALLQEWSLAAEDPLVRGLALIVGVLAAAALGQQLGARLGERWRSWVTFEPAKVADSLLGAVAAVVVGAGLIWFLAGAVIGTLPSPAPQAVTSSRVLQGIDRAMPAEADRVLSNAYNALDVNGFPRVFTGVAPEAIRPVDPPDPGVVEGQGVEAAADSVVKVTGMAADCGRGSSGSGWVAAPQRVVTNAHVVAGVDRPSVQVGGEGQRYAATTVAFDPQRDVAVLAVPGLDAPALPSGESQEHGDAVVVAGFPLGGPYDVEPGRVRDRIEARGAGIDGTLGATRDVYSVSARVEQGNSGGPLLSTTGQVVGTVFAKSVSSSGTGYVLTLDETRPVLEEGTRATEAVDTGSCSG
ncbi:MAG TPA: MarP family serine protease [Candidatus Janibacter merdipullorum]|nr:MarP family serine protease [Candidatus Janibacter merdipullorum]